MATGFYYRTRIKIPEPNSDIQRHSTTSDNHVYTYYIPFSVVSPYALLTLIILLCAGGWPWYGQRRVGEQRHMMNTEGLLGRLEQCQTCAIIMKYPLVAFVVHRTRIHVHCTCIVYKTSNSIETAHNASHIQIPYSLQHQHYCINMYTC